MQPEESGSTRGTILGLPQHFEDYFLDEIQHGEVLITEGNFEGGIDQLVKTIVECNDPDKLYRHIQATMPDEVSLKVAEKLIIYNKTMQEAKTKANSPSQGLAASNGSPKESSDDTTFDTT